MAMVGGETGLVTKGPAFEMPSLLMGEVEPVTPNTLLLQKTGTGPGRIRPALPCACAPPCPALRVCSALPRMEIYDWLADI